MLKGVSFNNYFSLSHCPYQIWADVANTIKMFYPINVDIESSDYKNHTGLQKLNRIIEDNILDNDNFNRRWGSFLKVLRKDLNKSSEDLFSTTYGLVPGFSADLILERYENDSLIHIKRLMFAVSLIGPFYSICGIDETFIKNKYHDHVRGSYQAINVITTSPHAEFEKEFNHLQRRIETSFNGYKFVPITMCLKMIEGVHHDFLESRTVYGALFNHLFDFYYFPFARYRGDKSYGYGENMNISRTKVVLTAPPKND